MRRALILLFQWVVGRYGLLLQQYRSLLVVCIQLGLIILANVTAFALRFDGDIPPFYQHLLIQGSPIILAVFGFGMFAFGIQQGLWRYVGLHDLARILWASVTSSALSYAALHWVFGWVAYPRSVIILTGLLGGFI